jgi:tripartite-type tricarboxylate transporter receptor subunit TctC
MSGSMSAQSASTRLFLIVSTAVAVLGSQVWGRAAIAAGDFYRGKTMTLFAGQPPGGGIDSEMRLVARFLGDFLPGGPAIIPRNMPGAGGVILGNYLYSIAKPDGLTLGMPGRSGFVLAPITSVADVKFDLRRFTWIGSSASTNYLLWLRRDSGIGSFNELKAAKRQLVIGGSGATTANSVVPELLARYQGFPFRVVRGYPGMNDAILAMERREVDGVFTHRASLRPDLVASGDLVPIFQTFAIEPDLPALDVMVTNPRQRALLNLLNAPLRLGLAVVAPPGLPDDLTRTLRQAYAHTVASQAYQAEAARRGFDVGRPIAGEEIADYVAGNLSAVPADVVREYREILEH